MRGQVKRLSRSGCRLGQGFHFARPGPLEIAYPDGGVGDRDADAAAGLAADLGRAELDACFRSTPSSSGSRSAAASAAGIANLGRLELRWAPLALAGLARAGRALRGAGRRRASGAPGRRSTSRRRRSCSWPCCATSTSLGSGGGGRGDLEPGGHHRQRRLDARLRRSAGRARQIGRRGVLEQRGGHRPGVGRAD